MFLAPKMLYDTCSLCILVSRLKIAPTSSGITGMVTRVEVLFLVSFSVPRTKLHKCIFFRLQVNPTKLFMSHFFSLFRSPSSYLRKSKYRKGKLWSEQGETSSTSTYYLSAFVPPSSPPLQSGPRNSLKKQKTFSLERNNRKRMPCMWKASWLC